MIRIHVLAAVLLLLLAACGPKIPSIPNRINADKAKLSTCELAMQAAAMARKTYDGDYETRTGNSSVPVTVDDFDSCFWAEDGVFLGTLGHRRIRWVPRDSASMFMFTTDPRQIMKSDGDEHWFSEWRGEPAPDDMGRALSAKFASASPVFVD